MKVLVTGGAGYIGSHACKALALAGHEPVVFDNLSTGHKWAVKWGPCIVADLFDTAALDNAMHEHRIEAVMHFAGSSIVGESTRDPLKYFLDNAAASSQLFASMARFGVNKVIFSSSCAVYGLPARIPMDETHPLAPANPYGESKLAVENTLRWLGALKGLRWIALRYFNAAGADPDGEIGESHDQESHLIPLALRAAAPGDARLGIFGTDYPTPDGTAIRDYVHVTDIARAHVLALDKLDNAPINEAINLGTGSGSSVKEVVCAVEKVTGSPVRQLTAPRRPGDPPQLVADASKARSVVGWLPKRSALETILVDAWKWERSAARHGNGRN